MKTQYQPRKSDQAGSALMLTMIMTGVALAILASAMAWSSNNTNLTHRSIQHARAIAAAEAATEKVLSKITRDFLSGDEKIVTQNLANYRQTLPTSADSAFWTQWRFNDGAGNAARTYVLPGSASNFIVLNSAYSGLKGFVSTYTIVAHARDSASLQNVIGGVFQEVQLAHIPIFQFAMYGSADMEISCGQDFNITGRVHANGTLYVEPDKVLTFQSDVTSAVNILFERHPLDTRGVPGGSAVYQQPDLKKSPVPAMTLPIGTTNTPKAIRAIIQPPLVGEDPNSPIGQLRYYNLAEMVLVVSDSGISATSGRFNNFATAIPTNELALFVTTTNSFRDAREEKTVRPVDINVAVLKSWSETNSTLRGALSSNILNSVYVLDLRTTLAATSLAAVRVRYGTNLPSRGLTIATARPLYIQGHYNQTNSLNLGTTNTISTSPASLVGDAVTILSENWTDAKSTLAVASRTALPTTINAAILTGVVETTAGKYSGGMENFPRFLETWGAANPLRYNGSMVKMFPSLYATNAWGKADVYAPPKRDWAFDLNFNNPAKLPPLTPSLLKVIRGRWATVAPGINTVAAIP